MPEGILQLDEERWRAIVSNDASYDDRFIYAVKTTRIYCRPSCRSRVPHRENVVLFRDAREAETAMYRPCKRCKPDSGRAPGEEWMEQIRDYIDRHYAEPISLRAIAENCHGSPYHLQRMFKRWSGMTPLEYIQSVRVRKAGEALVRTNLSILEIARSVGIPNPSYFTTLFKQSRGLTPGEYRQRAEEADIKEEHHG